MNENLILKSTVTGKNQITIPKKLCENFNINKGDKIIFETEGDKIIFFLEKQECFACKGSKKIGKNECFLCRGTGELSHHFSKNIFDIIKHINMYSLKYNIEIIFLSNKNKGIPVIKLRSENYPIDEINRIQDELQKLVIKHFSPKSIENKDLFSIPSDTMLNTILDTLITKNAKETVRKWFRYEKTI